MQAIEITLSDWVFNAINEKGKDLLTISRDYFRLRKPLERRLYEVARKMCGQSTYWHLRLQTLHSLTGSASTQAEFKRMMKAIINDNATHQHIPDYTFELDGNLIKIRPRGNFTEIYTEAETIDALDKITLKGSTMEVARKFNGGWDVYFLQDEWRSMLHGKKAIPDNPDGSFIGYVKWYVGKNGRA